MPKNITKQKTIKAWAILGKYNKVASVVLSRAKPTRYYIGSWVGFVTEVDKVIRITITYNVKK